MRAAGRTKTVWYCLVLCAQTYATDCPPVPATAMAEASHPSFSHINPASDKNRPKLGMLQEYVVHDDVDCPFGDLALGGTMVHVYIPRPAVAVFDVHHCAFYIIPFII